MVGAFFLRAACCHTFLWGLTPFGPQRKGPTTEGAGKSVSRTSALARQNKLPGDQPRELLSCPLPSFLVAWSILVSRLSVSNDTPKGSNRFSAARLGIEVVYHRCLLQAASIFALRPCSLLECQGKIKNANYNLWTQTTVLGLRSVQVHLAPIFEEILFLPSHGIGYTVWDTRFSLLDWVRVAGLPCTKGVWYIYMIGILDSLSDVVEVLCGHSSCNLDM